MFDFITDSLSTTLIDSILSMMQAVFNITSDSYGDITAAVGMTPQGWNGTIYSIVHRVSETVMTPIATIILTFVVSYELYSMLIDRNNMNDIEYSMLFKWMIKATVACLVASNAWTAVMAVFDVAQNAVSSTSGMIGSSLAGISTSTLDTFRVTLESEPLSRLILIFLQSVLSWALMYLITLVIMIVLWCRMVEIYITISVAPIPFAAFFGREWTGGMGANYIRSVIALVFQGFFIVLCLLVYTSLMGTVFVSGDIVKAMWQYLAYSGVLLFSIYKTSSISKTIFSSH